jgi:ABC-type transport system involved in Fe-S cluster assembly fused permease/ATPase subunit
LLERVEEDIKRLDEVRLATIRFEEEKAVSDICQRVSRLALEQAIEKLMRNRTVIVIAHRLSTVHNADKIIVLDKGKIVDQGSHQELINRDGIYKQLHNMQFQT